MKFSAGDTIIEVAPYVSVLNEEERLIRCDNCLEVTPGAQQRCSACKKVVYCNRACQKSAWKLHKAECGLLLKVKEPPCDKTLMLFRLLAKVGKKDWATVKDVYGLRSLEQLMTHADKGGVRLDSFRAVFQELSLFMKDSTISAPREHCFLLHCKIITNGLGIVDEEGHFLGSGIFLSPAYVDHSCSPNAECVWFQGKLHMKAIEEIPRESETDFSKVRICYSDFKQSAQQRRKQLKVAFCFDCWCPRCSSELSGVEELRCPDEDCAGVCAYSVSSQEVQPCSLCGTEVIITPAAMTDAQEKMAQVAWRFTLETAECRDKKSLLKWLDNPFHRLHHCNFMINDILFSLLLEDHSSDDSKAVNFALKFLLPAYEKHLPKNSPYLGRLQWRLAKMLLQMRNTSKALEYCEHSLKILKVTLDAESSLLAEIKASIDICKRMLQTETRK